MGQLFFICMGVKPTESERRNKNNDFYNTDFYPQSLTLTRNFVVPQSSVDLVVSQRLHNTILPYTL